MHEKFSSDEHTQPCSVQADIVYSEAQHVQVDVNTTNETII